MSIEVTGDEGAAKTMRLIGKLNGYQKYVVQAGQLLETAIKGRASGRPGPNAPTGDYRGSWTTTLTNDGAGSIEVTVSTNKPQGRALEYGHPRWAPGTMYPHVQPAISDSEPRIVKFLEDRLGKEIP